MTLLYNKPNSEGWWWVRRIDNDVPLEWYISRIVRYGGKLTIRVWCDGAYVYLDVDQAKSDEWTSQWYGPIEEPQL